MWNAFKIAPGNQFSEISSKFWAIIQKDVNDTLLKKNAFGYNTQNTFVI